MGKRRNSKLAVGDKVVAKFLGGPVNGVISEIVDRHTYKVRTKDGTVLPSCQWEDKSPKNKKGVIISPWYIVKTGHQQITNQ
tara:strand:- start:339 stop:584 length:246 start_codon:yes stop_codon:yes gene_type:complete